MARTRVHVLRNADDPDTYNLMITSLSLSDVYEVCDAATANTSNVCLIQAIIEELRDVGQDARGN